MAREPLRITIDPQIIKAVNALADTERRTQSNMVEVLLAEALTAREAKPAA